MEQSTEFFIRERTSKRHSVACAPERSATRTSLDSHLKRRRTSSTSQHSRTFSKGDTDSGSEAELIRTSSLHKYLEECSLPAVFDKVQSTAKRGSSAPAPLPQPLPLLLASDTSSVLWVTPARQPSWDQALYRAGRAARQELWWSS